MNIPDDLSALDATTYDHLTDPIQDAALLVATTFSKAREIFIARRRCPDAYRDHRVPLDDLSTAPKAIGLLLDAGWNPPTA